MSYDKDCSTQFPHRSQIVIDKKKHDEYCFSIKSCSEWTDLSKNSDGQPLPFPSQCTPNTYKKLPIITRGSLCNDIKKEFGSLQDISNNLADNKMLFNTIKTEYTNKYVEYLKFPSDQSKDAYESYEQDWFKLKQDLIKEETSINTMLGKYQERINGVHNMLEREIEEHDIVTDNINKTKRRVIRTGSQITKTNNYNSTSGHIVKTIYYSTAIVIMGIFLTKLK